jgi:polyphenol oxidase
VIRKKNNGIEWLEFEQLQGVPSLQHAVFLRHGGISKNEFGTLNTGKSTNDDILCVEENRARILSLFPKGHLISGIQVHGDTLHEVKRPYLSEVECDGFITKEKHNALMIKHADCQSTIFYDPIERALAHVHCGWKGNVLNIYQKTVDKLKHLGSNPANILVCISPSLGPEFSEFINHQKEFPSHFLEFQWRENYFNLWEISRMQLMKAGILLSHIECAEICTYQNEIDFFSYRRDRITGRNASLSMLY